MSLPMCPRNGAPPKRTYASEREALTASKEQTRKPGRPKRLRVYHCYKCKGWHLTSLK